jgi:hypothetical protein
MPASRQWTIYIAQDKHLDYNWCGANTEVELRMVALMDYYIEQGALHGGRWNLDGTVWADVYRRHRGEAGLARLYEAIRGGYIGYAGNYSVMLWGILSTELAVRACYGAVPIEQATGVPALTALTMENAGLPAGVPVLLAACGFGRMGRGSFALRGESYHWRRDPYPVLWWQTLAGTRLLVHWGLPPGIPGWCGYAEGWQLAVLAGETWDAYHVVEVGDRNTPEVYAARKRFIHDTVARYEACGADYPLSSLMLLGTGADNWVQTQDYRLFIERFNADPEETIRLVDARYEDFFAAAEREIETRGLTLPVLEGSFGICWEEWASYLAGPTQDFREAQRLLIHAEAAQALALLAGEAPAAETNERLREAWRALLDFAEHDFGGVTRRLAALSAGARAAAAACALDLARSLCPEVCVPPARLAPHGAGEPTFTWRDWQVVFDAERCAIGSLRDADGCEWVPAGGPALGEFVSTRYGEGDPTAAVFPPALPWPALTEPGGLSCRETAEGLAVGASARRWGFALETSWLFHAERPWIDVTYRLADGWTDDAQSVQFRFPLAVATPVYRYDSPGAILTAGPQSAGGDDLPGANPELFAAQTFAAATGEGRGLILLMPDAFLVQFGAEAVRAPEYAGSAAPCQITSLAMLNLTRGDHQLGQAGQREWTYRYRIVLTDGCHDPVAALGEAQRFGTPPFLMTPGVEPVLPGLGALGIRFEGGPVTALKVAEDGERVIVRLWNVLGHRADGSLALPEGWRGAQECDALERPQADLRRSARRVCFGVDAGCLATIALLRADAAGAS